MHMRGSSHVHGACTRAQEGGCPPNMPPSRPAVAAAVHSPWVAMLVGGAAAGPCPPAACAAPPSARIIRVHRRRPVYLCMQVDAKTLRMGLVAAHGSWPGGRLRSPSSTLLPPLQPPRRLPAHSAKPHVPRGIRHTALELRLPVVPASTQCIGDLRAAVPPAATPSRTATAPLCVCTAAQSRGGRLCQLRRWTPKTRPCRRMRTHAPEHARTQSSTARTHLLDCVQACQVQEGPRSAGRNIYTPPHRHACLPACLKAC
jgi:hypothetical protein